MRKRVLSRNLYRFPDFCANEDLSILLEKHIDLIQSTNTLRVVYLPADKIAEIDDVADSADNFYRNIAFERR